MLKIIDRYIAKKFLINLIVGMFGSIVIFFSFDFFAIIEKVTAGKLSLIDVPMLSLKSIPSIISYEMMHLASLIAALLTMNDLSSHLEVIALKTSGISFYRIVTTPLIIAAIFSGGMFLFTEYVSVWTHKQKKDMFQKIDGIVISKNRDNIYYRSGNRFFRMGNVNGYTNKVRDIQIIEMNNNSEIIKIINARSGFYAPETGTWTLEYVIENLIENNQTLEHATYSPEIKESIEDFLKYKFILDSSSDSDNFSPQNDFAKELSFKQIRDNISFLQSAGGNYKRLSTHVHHQRVAYPFSIFVMTAIGFALLNKFSRSGKSKSIVFGIFIGYAYYLVVEVSKAIGLGGFLPITISAWIPNLFFALLGIYLFIMAND
jgi:lipopolysaccharide export system permease protein